MSRAEGALSSEGLSEDELKQFVDYCRVPAGDHGDFSYMRWFLALSEAWRLNDETPRVVLTLNWHAPFFKGFYPELKELPREEEIKGFRTLATLDGEAWVALKMAAPLCDPENTDTDERDYWLEKANEFVNGRPMDPDEQARLKGVGCDPLITGRIENGMNRQMRMLSGMIMTPSSDALTNLPGVVEVTQNILKLTQAEQTTIYDVLVATGNQTRP